jgi:class 3 adenylate cyclase
MQPETTYTRLGGDRIAYQVIGHGPPDLVLAMSFSHVDMVWDDPAIALFLRRLASFSRLICFDRRGTGASDPLPSDTLPPWEVYAEELAAVLDAVGSQRTALMATTPEAGPMALFFAGTRPERISALILANSTAKFVAADDYAIGLPREAAETILNDMQQTWGTEAMGRLMVSSRAGDERFFQWGARLHRAMASPKVVQAYLRALFQVDVRPILPLIHAPTLVMHRRDYPLLPIEHSRYLAQHIPGARFVELPGADGLLWYETPELTIDVVEEFLTGVRRIAKPTRVLATVLFTDIVASTEQAGRLGDRRWRELLDVHDQLARRLVERWGGHLVKTTGDGVLATFEGPGRGIGCAAELREELRSIGVRIRSGLHTGEVERRDGDVGGIAVHIAARVLAAAGPEEILLSRTVRDLVTGSDVTLEDRGTHALKGVEGTWELFSVARPWP